MNHVHDQAGPSHAATAVSQRPAVQHSNPFSISCLLEFQDARVEAAYQQYMYKMQQAADTCLIIANLLALAVACVKQCSMPTSSAPASAMCYLSGGQALLLLLLLIAFPAAYARHRALVLGCTRMYRLGVWLACLREPYPPRLLRRNLSIRLFLLSPCGGNVWLALFYPLPLLVHVLLLGVSSIVAVWRSQALHERLRLLDVSPEHLTNAYHQLSRFSRCAMSCNCACSHCMHGSNSS